MLVIAHRGANREALENSWDAFEKAVECGARRIELDVHLSADGHVAINHDDHLVRTTGLDKLISTMTRAELARVRLNDGSPLPFLDEVLTRLLARIEINIEIKGRGTPLAEAVGEICRAAPLAREKVVISCFSLAPLEYLREHYPELKRACLWGEDTWEWPHIGYYAPPVFMGKAHAQIFHPRADQVDANMMDQAKARGWKVYPWVPMAGEEENREGLWATLATLAVDGLCTNYPRELGRWLKSVQIEQERFKT